MPDFRDLISHMADELDYYRISKEGDDEGHPFAREARATLRAARRPEPPSLKEQGRKALERISNSVVMATGGAELDVLKAIIESLPD